MGNSAGSIQNVLPDNNIRIDTFMRHWTEPIIYFIIFAGLGMKCVSKYQLDLPVLRAVL